MFQKPKANRSVGSFKPIASEVQTFVWPQRVFLLLVCLLLVSAHAVAVEAVAQPQKRVLVIYSSRKDAPYIATVERAYLTTFTESLAGHFDYYAEFLDLSRFSSPDYQEALGDFLRRKYATKHLDVILAEGDAPIEFLRQRTDVFPGVPIVFSSEKKDVQPIPNSTGLVYEIDMKSSLDVALGLQPKIKQVFVVCGKSEFDKFYEQIARRQFQAYEGRVPFTYVTPMLLDDLLNEAGHLPEGSIIYFVSFFEDGAGNKYIPHDVLDKLSPAANVPLYSWPELAIEHGIVGGNLLSEENAAQQTAALAMRVMRGESPANIPVAEMRPYVKVFNWRELRRWQISEAQLPPGSVVRFRQLSFWQQYKGRIVAVFAVMLLQMLLIAGLLVERSRKKRAGRELAESEERFAKAFRSNPQPMSLTNLAEGRYVDVNESFLRMSGFARDEVIGRTSVELGIFETVTNRKDSLVDTLLQSGVVRNIDMKFRTKSGALRALLSSAEIIELAGEKCILMASSDITERKSLEQELMQLTGELFRLQDDERRRIARDLHDGTAQNLFAISINLAKLGQLDETQKQEMQRLISECTALGNQSLQEIRTLSYLLHPPLLDQVGLVGALKWYVDGFSKRSGICVDVTAEPIDRLSGETELALFRIVQESLTNVSRHSGSGTASVRLERRNGEVFLTIADCGHGLPGRKTLDGPVELAQMGVGIPGMRQRLQQLGGRLELESDDRGTIVRAVVPLTNGAHNVANPARG